MHLFNIFLLHAEQTLQYRTRNFVWFFITLFNQLMMILFWIAVYRSSPTHPNISQTSLYTYYLVLVVIQTVLMSHIEEDIAYLDIKEGQLSKYLIKPFSYYWIKFYEEIPYRLLQGIFAIVAFSFFYIFFNTYFRIHLSMTQALLSICIMLAAYFLSFTFKMVIGMIAFWITDIGGVFEILEIILIIFTGNLMPLFLLPQPLSSITLLLPFASMIYYPVMAIEGNLDILHMSMALGQQLIWLGFFLVLYMFMWNKGVKKFSGVGQ